MRKRQKINFKVAVCFLVFFILIAFSTYFVKQFRKEVAERAGYSAKVLALETINDSIKETLADTSFDLIEVNKDNMGKVVSIETKIDKIALVKTDITEKIIKKLNAYSKNSVKIPLGNMSGNAFLSAKGPMIECSFIPAGALDVKTLSKIEASGINQTRHSIVIEISVEITAITSFCRVNVSTPAEVILAETIVVGSVPESYTQVLTDDSELLGNINDYKAGIK